MIQEVSLMEHKLGRSLPGLGPAYTGVRKP
jgi:hypothetical protein